RNIRQHRERFSAEILAVSATNKAFYARPAWVQDRRAVRALKGIAQCERLSTDPASVEGTTGKLHESNAKVLLSTEPVSVEAATGQSYSSQTPKSCSPPTPCRWKPRLVRATRVRRQSLALHRPRVGGSRDWTAMTA